jgi:hypothetical protein
VEGDFGFANKTTTVSGLYYPNTLNGFNGAAADFSVRTNWDASVRARVGYLVTRANLIYLTGGASWLRVNTNSVCSTNQFTGTCRPGIETPSVIAHSNTRLGWTIGGGFESKLWQNWLARAEYRYTDYGASARPTRVRSCSFRMSRRSPITSTFGRICSRLGWRISSIGPIRSWRSIELSARHCEERSDGTVSLFVDRAGRGRIVLMVEWIGWCGMRVRGSVRRVSVRGG